MITLLATLVVRAVLCSKTSLKRGHVCKKKGGGSSSLALNRAYQGYGVLGCPSLKV